MSAKSGSGEMPDQYETLRRQDHKPTELGNPTNTYPKPIQIDLEKWWEENADELRRRIASYINKFGLSDKGIDVDDVMGDTIIGLLENIKKGHFDSNRGSLLNFVMGIARNKAQDALRFEHKQLGTKQYTSKKNRKILDKENTPPETTLFPIAKTPNAYLKEVEHVPDMPLDEAYGQQNAEDRVADCLEAMEHIPSSQKDVIVKKELGGMPFDEIAVAMSTSEVNARKLHSRGCKNAYEYIQKKRSD